VSDNGCAMVNSLGGGPGAGDAELDPAHPGRALVRLAERIGRNVADRAACLEAITETAAAIISVQRVGIWLYDDAHTRIECVDLFEAPGARHSHGLHIQADQFPIYFHALEQERIIAAHDAERDERTAEFTSSYLRPIGIGAMLDAPIRVSGRMVGVICHECIGPAREWTSGEQALAATMGDFVALSIESAQRARAETERSHLADRLSRARKMVALGRLAGSIAHDFNNLLTAIHGSLELMKFAERQGPVEPGMVHAEIEQIECATDRAGLLVKQLQEFSRHERSPTPLTIKPVAVLENMAELLRRLLGETVELSMRLEDDTPSVDIDPDHFQQVILNLASNARDAMPDGGKLSIETRCFRDHRAGEPDHDWLDLLVADTGDGIPDEALPLVFEPFYSTKLVGTGWGLGLATVQRIVEEAGGHVFVRSRMHEGTTFRIRLPASTRAEPTIDPSRPHAAHLTGQPAPGSRETVLVCEDEERVRRLMEEALANDGYHVISTEDAAEAREQVRRHDGPIHLLLTDVIMPGTNGLRLAAEIASAQPGLRVLYISGYPARELRRNGIEAEGLPLIEKPFKAAEIVRRVRQALDA